MTNGEGIDARSAAREEQAFREDTPPQSPETRKRSRAEQTEGNKGNQQEPSKRPKDSLMEAAAEAADGKTTTFEEVMDSLELLFDNYHEHDNSRLFKGLFFSVLSSSMQRQLFMRLASSPSNLCNLRAHLGAPPWFFLGEAAPPLEARGFCPSRRQIVYSQPSPAPPSAQFSAQYTSLDGCGFAFQIEQELPFVDVLKSRASLTAFFKMKSRLSRPPEGNLLLKETSRLRRLRGGSVELELAVRVERVLLQGATGRALLTVCE